MGSFREPQPLHYSAHLGVDQLEIGTGPSLGNPPLEVLGILYFAAATSQEYGPIAPPIHGVSLTFE